MRCGNFYADSLGTRRSMADRTDSRRPLASPVACLNRSLNKPGSRCKVLGNFRYVAPEHGHKDV
jgi:hypothetical protein